MCVVVFAIILRLPPQHIRQYAMPPLFFDTETARLPQYAAPVF